MEIKTGFRISPTFLLSMKTCPQKAYYGYVKRLRLAKENVGLLRGRIIHRAVQILILGMANPEYTQYLGNPKRLINRILSEYAGTDNVYEGIKEKYEFPKSKVSFFTWADFQLQLLSAVEIFIDFIKERELKPILNSNVPMVEHSSIFETPKGIALKGIIDLGAVDKSGEPALYDWKVGMKKYTTKEGISPADTNDALIAYALAAVKSSDIFSFPVKTFIVRSVVTKKGKKSESVMEKKGGKLVGTPGLEVFPRTITNEEAGEFLRTADILAEDFMNSRFIKCKGEHCITMCDFRDICFNNKVEGYVEWDKDWNKEKD
jgi:hypothetical protein